MHIRVATVRFLLLCVRTPMLLGMSSRAVRTYICAHTVLPTYCAHTRHKQTFESAGGFSITIEMLQGE
jgi:hypothetical protein